MIAQNMIWIFLGGGIGSVLRYLLSKTLNPMFSNFFVGTMVVNLLGSFLIGVILGLEIKSIIQKPMLTFLVIGFCGGFTTFSTFALENFNLIKSEQYFMFLLYMFSSIIAGILAVGLGFFVVKQI